MVLSLPSFSFTIEGNLSVELKPRLINLDKLLPLGMSLRRT